MSAYSDTVIAAMQAAGLPLPDPGRVIYLGFTAAERQAIDKEQARRVKAGEDQGLDYWAQP
jgi:hypothetical protein